MQRLQLERDQFAETQRRNQVNEAQSARELDMRDADRRDRNNVKGVRRMLGEAIVQRTGPMTDDDRRGLAALQVEAGDAPTMLQDKPDKTYTVTVPGPNGKPMKKIVGEKEMQAGVEEYVEPKAPEKPDYEWVTNQDGVVRQVIKGHALPGEVPITAAGVQTGKQRQAADDRQAEGMRQYRSDMLNVVNRLIDEAGNLKPDVKGVIGGAQGAVPEGLFFGESSQEALSAINRLQGLLDLKKLGDLKSQSRTGATGFGQLSEKELAVLENAASTLRNRRQGEVSYASELRRIRDELSRAQGGPVNNPGISIGDPAAAAQALIDRARAGRKKP